MKILGLMGVIENFLTSRRINKRNKQIVALRRKAWTYRAIGEHLGVPKDTVTEVCFREMGSSETKSFNYQKGEKK